MNYRYVHYVSLLVLEVAMESGGARFRNAVAAGTIRFLYSRSVFHLIVNYRSVIEG